MNRIHNAWPMVLVLLAALVVTTAPVIAGEPHGEHQEVHLKKIVHKCEGNDCGDHSVIIEKLLEDCEGDDCPKVKVLRLENVMEECEGDDCPEHAVFIKKLRDCEGDDCPEIRKIHLGDLMDDCEGDDCDHDFIITALAGDCEGDDCPKVKKIHLEKAIGDCEDDDCPETKHHRRMIMIGDDGEVHQLGGGHEMRWFGKGGGHQMHWIGEGGASFAMRHHGKGGFLGVASTELTPELRTHFGVPEDAGVLVAKVVDDSAAANAGLQVGDVLTGVDGDAVESTGDLLHAIGRHEPGATVELEVYRDGARQTLSATLGERQAPRRHAMLMHCDDEDSDCPKIATLREFDCGGDSDCEIEIECRDGGCDCTVNGETTDCEALPGFEAPGE